MTKKLIFLPRRIFIILHRAIFTMLIIVCSNYVIASDVILSSEDLNSTLKKMEKIQIDLNVAPEADIQSDLLFQLGTLADGLASQLTNELLTNGMQQQGLIELAMIRTGELGVDLLWFPDKQRFIYDGDAFRQYLGVSPAGMYAAESDFRLIEIDFFQSTGDDIDSLLNSTQPKKEFLKKYPDHRRSSNVGLLLAIDYRDVWRLYNSEGVEDNAQRYADMTREQFKWVIETFSGAEEASIAGRLLGRFETELKSPAPESNDDIN